MNQGIDGWQSVNLKRRKNEIYSMFHALVAVIVVLTFSMPIVSLIIGVVITQTSTASVPSGRFVGKSPEYIAAYTSSYQAKTREMQSKDKGNSVILRKS